MSGQKRRKVTVPREGIIKGLSANLDERYKEFFCIVQELLQNADDAGASTFAIGRLERLSEKHELLNTPGVLVLNNGKVTESDVEAIFKIQDSNKSCDAAKIGKFGLGMKSVLHLCENFLSLGVSERKKRIL